MQTLQIQDKRHTTQRLVWVDTVWQLGINGYGLSIYTQRSGCFWQQNTRFDK